MAVISVKAGTCMNKTSDGQAKCEDSIFVTKKNKIGWKKNMTGAEHYLGLYVLK